jgi:uncharacterized protein YjeT (DUF2065 family)
LWPEAFSVVSFGSRENPGFFASVGIMWQELGIALCLLLVLEGILPFLCPRQWRDALLQLVQLSDRRLRLMGLASMLLGTAFLYWLH